MVVNSHSGNGGNRHQSGFTYMGLLIILAISSIAMGGVAVVWHQSAQHEREIELNFVGKAYQKAIGSYYESKVNGVRQFPEKLEELVLDERFTAVKRHIRTLYADPIEPKKPWALVLEKGRIIGVYSQSKKVMIEQGSLKGSTKYDDLKFIYTPITTETKSPPKPVPDNLSTDHLSINKQSTEKSLTQLPENLSTALGAKQGSKSSTETSNTFPQLD